MAIKLKPKSFGPVISTNDGSPMPVMTYPSNPTPVDVMLGSLAACLVLSIKIAADAKKLSVNPFEVRVTGVKATDLPSRVGRINIEIPRGFLADASMEEAIAKQAKSACTVSNTLNAEMTLSLV